MVFAGLGVEEIPATQGWRGVFKCLLARRVVATATAGRVAGFAGGVFEGGVHSVSRSRGKKSEQHRARDKIPVLLKKKGSGGLGR